MTITAPIPVAALPPHPSPDRPDTFDNEADIYVDAQPAMINQVNASNAVTYQNALAAAAAATSATASAVAASGSAAAAAGSADDSQLDAAAAVAAASAASASATAAANSALALTTTSTSANTLGTGTKTYIVEAGKQFVLNGPVYAVDSANSANFIAGTVASYSGNTLTITGTSFGGSGSITSWNITVSGARGATGATGGTAGGTLTGLLAELKGASITAATTTNVWATTGNSAALIGTTAITSFGTAPQAGAKFTLIATAATLLTHGANLVLPGAANFTLAVGDRVDIYANTTTQHIVSVTRADGRAVVASINSVSSTVTTDATLTAASAGYQFVQMASLGRSLKLPPANTMPLGGPLYLIDNTKGAFSAGIRDDAGTLIMAVAPGGEALVSLKDNSTAAGQWSVTGSGLEPGLMTISTRLTSFMFDQAMPIPFVALDNNVSIHFAYWNGTSFYAFVVDNLGRTIPTPISVSAGGGLPVTAFKISATQAIVFYGTGAADHKAVVLTLTGSTGSYSISVGTPVAATNNMGGTWGREDFKGAPSVVQLTPTLYLAIGANGSSSRTEAMAISVSGSTVTIGTALTSIVGAPSGVTLYALTATTALAIICNNSNLYAGVLTVSGTTVTAGAFGTVSGVLGSSAGPTASALLSPTKALVLGGDANPNIAALTISGTSVTAGTAVGVIPAVDSMTYTTDRTSRYNPHLWAIGPNSAVVRGRLQSSGPSTMAVVTESGGVISLGQPSYGDVNTSALTVIGDGQLLPPGSTEFLSVRLTQPPSAGYAFQVAASKISGTTISSGTGETLRDAHPQSLEKFLMAKTQNGDYGLITTGAAGTKCVTGSVKLVIMRSNGDRVINRGSISIPEMCFPSGNPTSEVPNPLPSIGPSRFVLVGGAVGSSNPANSSFLQVLNVEIAA